MQDSEFQRPHPNGDGKPVLGAVILTHMASEQLEHHEKYKSKIGELRLPQSFALFHFLDGLRVRLGYVLRMSQIQGSI